MLRGEFDRETSALLTAVLSPLAKPRPSSDTGPDPRSAAERQGDALVEVFQLAADTGTLPSEAGEKPHVLVTVPLDTLRAGIVEPVTDVGYDLLGHRDSIDLSTGGEGVDHGWFDRRDCAGQAVLDGVGVISAAAARRIACDAKVIPAVLGSRSEPLDLGRASYTIPTALRRALVLRDHGCAFPGCDRSHRWCHGHHIEHWADGGPTQLDNLVLLCGTHHRLVHHSPWECAIRNGRAEFRPPAFVDHAREPRHNLVHSV